MKDEIQAAIQRKFEKPHMNKFEKFRAWVRNDWVHGTIELDVAGTRDSRRRYRGGPVECVCRLNGERWYQCNSYWWPSFKASP